jgi:hypothetical protein
LNHTGFVLFFQKHAILRRNASDTLQRLDQLDARRASLRPTPSKSTPPLEADSRAVSLP